MCLTRFHIQPVGFTLTLIVEGRFSGTAEHLHALTHLFFQSFRLSERGQERLIPTTLVDVGLLNLHP